MFFHIIKVLIISVLNLAKVVILLNAISLFKKRNNLAYKKGNYIPDGTHSFSRRLGSSSWHGLPAPR